MKELNLATITNELIKREVRDFGIAIVVERSNKNVRVVYGPMGTQAARFSVIIGGKGLR